MECTRTNGTRALNSRIPGWRDWLLAARHATIILGFVLIALAWGAVEFDLWRERERAQTNAVRTTGNFVRLFERETLRAIKFNDRIIQLLQAASANGVLAEEFRYRVTQVNEFGTLTLQLSMADANGRVIASSTGPLSTPVDISDREHFRVHLGATRDALFISKPVLGRVSGQWSVQLSRAYRDPRGSFAGVIVASLSTDKIAALYESIDLGPDGAILLIGLDGAVRASTGFRVNAVGRFNPEALLLQRAATAPVGWFTSRGGIDGIARITSYRLLDGYPLAISVGQAEHHVFAEHRRNGFTYRSAAAIVTMIILMAIVFGMRHRMRLAQAQNDLDASNARVRERSDQLDLILDHINQGIMMVDADNQIVLMNRQMVRLLGLPETMLVRRPTFEELVSYQRASGEFDHDNASIEPHIRQNIVSLSLAREAAVYERVRPNGVGLEVRSVPLPNGGLMRTFTDITERKRTADKIAHMAHHDALTGLANRVLLRSNVELALARQRRMDESFALLLIDLDRFKAVNDTLGHGAGDMVLQTVAERLRGCVRDVDTIARLGGDEFAILQSGVESRADVEILARRVVDALSAPYGLDGTPAVIGASIGIAWSHDSPDIEQLFHNADLALYRVKAEGRNSFRLFEPEMDESARERRQLEAALRVARDRGEFEIHYQPIIDLATGGVTCVEALLRWNHPEQGRLSPAAFIPIAEEIGVMEAIDTWVIETACVEATRWPGEVSVAVNLSPPKFKRRNLPDVVRRVLAETGLPARRLELEISERILLRGEAEGLAVLQELHGLGVRIALDDFGTGHSSLSDLRAFRFDKIKIDRSFVAEMESRDDCAAIVASVAMLGRSIGAATTAEGVETAAQAELVRAAGCTEVQGYLYSYPLSAMAVMGFLRDAAGGEKAVA
jgi:diguanylate cyclase (GGDEF)-like protein/PAS domain S-box-containing protein